ncbi:proline rich protein [Roseibium sp. TrichSKD4]|uniref:DUF3306 domain-containing protein n=1 Tax=Roseibium sp. TrichSKD4 TaxID=744980 RepID=UPI0001E56FF9|nr:DUF3306 domain-containing protein [Roseibium sp. TrichSKD4]EFO30408.1 proline rich protein [Roseibium sp. TrichSKD4]
MTGTSDQEEGFLSRWSRRKQAVREGDLEAVEEPQGVEEADEIGDPSQEDPEIMANREAAEAIDLDSLTSDSDFTVFMKKGVPKALKTAALRKLWTVNPAFSTLDGLNDYDLNYNVIDKVLTQFQSAWEVGKGYKAKAEEMAAEAERLAAQLENGDGAGEASAASDGEENELSESVDQHATISEEPGSDERRHEPEPVFETPVRVATTSDLGGDEEMEMARKVPIRRRMAVRFDEE